MRHSQIVLREAKSGKQMNNQWSESRSAVGKSGKPGDLVSRRKARWRQEAVPSGDGSNQAPKGGAWVLDVHVLVRNRAQNDARGGSALGGAHQTR